LFDDVRALDLDHHQPAVSQGGAMNLTK